jgi:hypothetical protein
MAGQWQCRMSGYTAVRIAEEKRSGLRVGASWCGGAWLVG